MPDQKQPRNRDETVPQNPAMRLVKIECTGNRISAIGYVPEASDERIIGWVKRFTDTPADAFEGDVYIALNIPAPPEFSLAWGAFYFYVPRELLSVWCNQDDTGETPE